MSQSPLIQPRPLGPRVRDVTAPPDPPFTGFISKLQVIWKTLTAHLKDRDNPHGVTKAQVGLGNVDNTPDADKPVSRAAAAELAAAKSYAAGLVNDEAEARAAAVSALDAAKAAKATTLAGYGITDAKIANGVITLGANSIIPLTSHQPLTAYVTGGTYDSASKKILLKHGSTTLAEIDATAFIKDGMVSSVAISGGSLVITFNTDAGKDPVSIPLTDIFDPDNYYNKTAADTKFVAKEEGKGLSTNDYTDEDKVALAGKQNALSAQQLANIAAVPGKASKSDVDPLLFAQYYPDGSVKSAAEFTPNIKYGSFDTTNRTVSVLPFCNTGDSDNDNSGLVGRVVIPPFVDAQGNGYISDDGTRYKVVGVTSDSGFSTDENTNLTAIIAPNTVTSIGNYAFASCPSLTSVSLPTATSIGFAAFNYCPSLTSVDFGNTPRQTVPSLGESAFSDVPTSCTIIVPYTQYDAWKAASGWSSLPQEFVRHSEKADKPTTFTPGNLVKFDANGNPTDSGKSLDDISQEIQDAIKYAVVVDDKLVPTEGPGTSEVLYNPTSTPNVQTFLSNNYPDWGCSTGPAAVVIARNRKTSEYHANYDSALYPNMFVFWVQDSSFFTRDVTFPANGVYSVEVTFSPAKTGSILRYPAVGLSYGGNTLWHYGIQDWSMLQTARFEIKASAGAGTLKFLTENGHSGQMCGFVFSHVKVTLIKEIGIEIGDIVAPDASAQTRQAADARATHQAFEGKADKPATFTPGNIPKFDANGNPVDSEKKPSDFQSALSAQQLANIAAVPGKADVDRVAQLEALIQTYNQPVQTVTNASYTEPTLTTAARYDSSNHTMIL